MPYDYYVSQYSGEEIDERLTAAHNAVRYDAAQTLTDAQKKQARANIAAAPDGFGLGTISQVVTDFDTVKLNGWYYGAVGTAHAPDSEHSWSVCVTNLAHNSDVCIQDAYALANVNKYLHCRRLVYVNTATQNNPWEWVNPPLALGVEYRTTERYFGKPVYVKLVDFGALPNAGLKQVAHGVTNVAFAVVDLSRSIAGSSYNNLFPLNTNISGVDTSDGYINIRTLIDLSRINAIICLKYTKDAD